MTLTSFFLLTELGSLLIAVIEALTGGGVLAGSWKGVGKMRNPQYV